MLVHGLDAETELANILSNEILAEINREVVRTIYVNAKLVPNSLTSSVRVLVLIKVSVLVPTLVRHPLVLVVSTTCKLTPMVDGVVNAGEVLCTKSSVKQTSSLRKLVVVRVTSSFAPQMLHLLSQWVECSTCRHGEVASTGVDDTGPTMVGTIGGGRIKVFIDPYAGTGVSSTAKD